MRYWLSARVRSREREPIFPAKPPALPAGSPRPLLVSGSSGGQEEGDSRNPGGSLDRGTLLTLLLPRIRGWVFHWKWQKTGTHCLSTKSLSAQGRGENESFQLPMHFNARSRVLSGHTCTHTRAHTCVHKHAHTRAHPPSQLLLLLPRSPPWLHPL